LPSGAAAALTAIFLFFPAYFSFLLAAGRGRSRGTKSKAGDLPSVSAIIVAKGEGLVLPNTLKRLLEVDYPDERLEVLVAVQRDDVETMAACAGFGSRVKPVVSEEDRGKPWMLGLALREARGELLLLLDADSAVQPGCLKEMVGRLSGARCSVTGTPYPANATKGLLPLLSAAECAYFSRVCRAKESLCLFIPLPGFYSLVRRSDVERVGGWREGALAEDSELSLKLASAGCLASFSDTTVMLEAPASLGDFFRQRLRWYRGMLDAVWLCRRELGSMMPGVRLDAAVTLCVPLGLACFPALPAAAVLWPTYYVPLLAAVWAAEAAGAWLSVRGLGWRKGAEAAFLSLPYLALNSAVALAALFSLLLRVRVRWARTPKRGAEA
jgi:cellulose synthase/poly-beta-1,6-N-acetylglucosamine synthase-like glycosyltransferase